MKSVKQSPLKAEVCHSTYSRLTHTAIAVSASIILLFFILRGNKPLMNFLMNNITTPIKQLLGYIFGLLPFSAAELFYAIVILLILFLLVQLIRNMFKPKRLVSLYRFISSIACIGLTIYSSFCILWGINYYGDSFSDKADINIEPVSIAELTEVTEHFATELNHSALNVLRDDDLVYAVPLDESFEKSLTIYENVRNRFPFLPQQTAKPKAMLFSKIMSMINFSGFYFPFTGESNINVDCTAATIPATIAHELAHQYNIAAEQESNFLAIMACIESDDAAYIYSGYMLGYIHLSNALYLADYEAWASITKSLNHEARADLIANNEYWAKYSSPVSEAAGEIYDSFLTGYGQELGRKSYGACIDLLVAYRDKL